MIPRFVLAVALWQFAAGPVLAQLPAKAPAAGSARQRAQELAERAADVGLPYNLRLDDRLSLTQPAGNPDEALRLFTEALEADSNCVDAWLGRSRVRELLKDQVGAREDLQKAAALSADSLDLQYRLVSLAYDFEDAEAVRSHSAAWFKLATAAREKAGTSSDRDEELVRFALRAELWDEAIALCDRFIATIQDPRKQIPFPYLRGLALLARGKAALDPNDLSPRQDPMTSERIDHAAKNPQASAADLLGMARARVGASRLPLETWPLAARLEIYDLAIQKNPREAAAYYERAKLKWAAHKSLSTLAAGSGMTAGRTAGEFKLAGAYAKAKIVDDCEQAAKLGLNSKELADLQAEIKAYAPPKPKQLPEKKAAPAPLAVAVSGRLQWIETLSNVANRELAMLHAARAGDSFPNYDGYKYGPNRIKVLAEELLRLDPANADGWKLRGAYRIAVETDPAGSKEDLQKAAQLAPDRLDVQIELAQRALRMEDAAQARKVAAEAYRTRLASLAKASQPAEQDALLVEFAFLAEQWSDVVRLVPRPTDKPSSYALRRMRILSLLASGSDAQADEECNALNRSNQGSIGDRSQFVYRGKYAQITPARLLTLIENFRKRLAGAADLIAMYDHLLELDGSQGAAFVERAALRWDVRKAMIDAAARASDKSGLRDHLLNEVYTKARISSDLDAAERLNVADPRIAAIRNFLGIESLLADFERDPKNINADARQLLALARAERQSKHPLAVRIQLYDMAINAGPQAAEAYFERAELRFESALDVGARFREDVDFARRSRGKQDPKVLAEYQALDGKPIMADIDKAVALGMAADAVAKLEQQVRLRFFLGAPPGWAERMADVRQEAATLLAAKGIAEAVKPWDAFVQRYPHVWEVHLERLKFIGGNPPAAPPEQFASALDSALSLYPAVEKDQIDRYLALVTWYQEHNGKPQAAVICERCARAFPATGEAREQLGWAAFDAGNYLLARSSLAAALAGLEATAAAPVAAVTDRSAAPPARKHWSMGRLRRQVEVLGRLEGEPASAAALAQRANLWSLLGENKQAFADYARVIELAPTSVLARCWRAARHIAVRDFDAAQVDIDAAQTLDPRSPEAYACLGALRQAQGKLDDALKAFDTALECSPRRVEANLGRARIFHSRGDLQHVFEELATAALAPPPDRPLLLPEMPLTSPPAPAVAAAKTVRDPVPALRGAKRAAKPQAKGKPPASRLPKPVDAAAPAGPEAALLQALSWLTRDPDRDLFSFREFANSKTAFSPQEPGSIAQGLAALPADSAFRAIYEGAAWQPAESDFRHEGLVFSGSMRPRRISSEYRHAWRAARRRAARAETLEDRYALARSINGVESLDLLQGIDKAPAEYADPLLPVDAAERLRREAVELFAKRLSAFEASQGSEAWKHELVETRRQAEQFASIEKLDDALGEWLKLASRHGTEPVVSDAVRAEYNRFVKSAGANQEMLGRLAYRLGDYAAAHKHLSTALEQQDLKAPIELRRQVQILTRLLDNAGSLVTFAMRANALALAGEDRRAVLMYDQIVEKNPTSLLARCWRAGRHIALGNYPAAKADIDAAIVLHAESPLAHLCLGAWHQAQFELDAALEAYGKTISLDSRQTLAHSRRASIFCFRGDLNAAYAELQRGLAQEPNDIPSLLPERLARRAPAASDPRPAAALLPEGKLGHLLAEALVELARGSATTALDRLETIGSTSDDHVWFTRGMVEAVRDEDQLLFAVTNSSAMTGIGPEAGPLAARAAFENCWLDAAGDRFHDLYPMPGGSAARWGDAISSWAHQPVRYALSDERRRAIRHEPDPAETGLRSSVSLEELLSLERQVPQKPEFNAERLALLRRAADAPTRLYDDPLDLPGLTRRTRLTALVKLNSQLSYEWRNATKPGVRDQLDDEINAIETRIEALDAELAPVFSRGEPHDAEVYAMAENIRARSTPEQRLSDAEALVKAQPQNAIGYCLRAAAKMRLGKWSAAQADIDLIVRARPATAEVYIMRGVWHQAHYRLEEALADYAKAIALNPRLREPYLRRALIHYFQGKLNEAFDDGVQSATGDDTRTPQPLAVALDLPAAVPAPSDVRPAATLLEAIPAEHRKSFEAVLLKLVAGDVQGARDGLRSIPNNENEALRTIGLIDAFELLRDPKVSQTYMRRSWVEVFGMRALNSGGGFDVTPQEKPWAARRDQIERQIRRERLRRGLEEGQRLWTSATGRVGYYARRAANLVSADKPALAAAKLDLIAKPVAELRKSKESLPSQFPTEISAAVRLFDGAQAELALKTDDRAAAMQAIDRVLQRPAGSESPDEAARWPLRQIDLAWKMGDPYTCIDNFTRLIDRHGGGSYPASLINTRIGDVPTTWYASRGALWLALGRSEDAYLDFALAVLAHNSPQPMIDDGRRKFAGPLAGDPIARHIARLVAQAKSNAADGLPDFGVPRLEKALRLKPDNDAVKRLLATQLIERSKRRGYTEHLIDPAIADARAALALFPDDPKMKQSVDDMLANGTLEYAFLRSKEGEKPYEVQRRLRKAIEYRPGWPDQRFDLVIALFDGNRYDEALTESDRSAACFEAQLKNEAERKDWDRLKRQYATLLRYRALTLAREVPGNDRLGAELDLKRALELAPDDAATRLNRGKILFMIGRVEDAQPEFDRAVALDPKLAAVIDSFKKHAEGSFVTNSKEIHDRRYLLTGKQRYYAGEYDATLSDLARAAESFPDDLDLLAFRAGALLKLGKTDEGLADLQKALAKKPTALALTLSAEQSLAAGRFAEAEQAITEAMKLRGGGPRALGLRAIARAKQSKFDMAILDFFNAHQGVDRSSDDARWLARRIDEVDEFKLAEVDAGRQPATVLFVYNRKNLGDMLHDLAMRTDDPAKRAALLTRAAEKERHPLTCFEFGVSALGTAGQKRDLIAAARWFARAASAGHSEAATYVKWLEAYARIAPGGSDVATMLDSAKAESAKGARPSVQNPAGPQR